jgi:hypothetical protein
LEYTCVLDPVEESTEARDRRRMASSVWADRPTFAVKRVPPLDVTFRETIIGYFFESIAA